MPCRTDPLRDRRTEFRAGAVTFHITISIGIACANLTSMQDEILKEADDALYRAKITKNAVHRAHQDLPNASS
jgi:PleD family two-component response regulator